MHIRSERDAIEFLNNCLHDPAYGNDTPLTLERCALRIRLEPGNGKADRRMRRAVELHQRHINLTYLLAKTGTLSGRLSDYEKDMLSVAFSVEKGSTVGDSEFSKALKLIHKVMPQHWTMRRRNIVTAALCIAFSSAPFVYKCMDSATEIGKAQIAAASAERIAEKLNDANVKIAEVQAKAQIAVADAQARASVTVANIMFASSTAASDTASLMLATLAREDSSGLIGFAVSDYVAWRPAFMDLAPQGGSLQWNDNRPVQASTSKALAKAGRKKAAEQRRAAKASGRPELIETPWVAEVLPWQHAPGSSWGAEAKPLHSAPGAMRLGLTDA
jgi:hypothetical protein